MQRRRAPDPLHASRQRRRERSRPAQRAVHDSRTKSGSTVKSSRSAGTTAAISITRRRMVSASSLHDIVAVEVHDDVERLREHLADDPLGDVLPGHQRGVHQRVERFGRAVRVHRAEEAAAGVHRPAQLERLGAAHLTHHDPIRPHREHELHEVAQRDLAGAVERGRPDLVVGAVRDRHRELADLLTRPHAVTRRARRRAARRRAWSCRRPVLPTRSRGCAAA